MSFRPAKPTGEQAPAEGQERHTCWHFLGPGYTDLDPLSWDSEDVAFGSLNLAPKAVPAFGKKSQILCSAVVLPVTPSCIHTGPGDSLRPRAQGAPPPTSFSSSLDSSPGSGLSSRARSVSPSPQASSRALNHQQTRALARSRLVRVLLYLCVCVRYLNSPAMLCALCTAKSTCT